MVKGKVVAWNLAKGFGFVEADGEKAFVHTTDLNGGTLKVDADVTYETKESEKKGEKLVATNVKGPGVVPKPKGKGKLTGTVKKWSVGNSLGFIQPDGEDEKAKDVYVHSSAFGGGNLTVGKTVNFDVQDVEHKSGRQVATNVSGEAVRGVGSKKGTAKKWIFSKGFGFIEEDGKPTKEEGDENEIYVHCSELGGGYLIAGRQVFFDLEERENDEKKRTHAVNLSGPAVRPADVTTHVGGFGRGGFVGGRGGGRGGYGRGGKGFGGGKGGKGGK
eukprot:gene17507-26933_t